MIEADGLTKYYGDFIAIEDVSFRVPRGEIVAFLGPNGAGKSTTMKILTGYLAGRNGWACGHGRPMLGKLSSVDLYCFRLLPSRQGSPPSAPHRRRPRPYGRTAAPVTKRSPPAV
jgi:energy-coupling factor transporter ATP-binding protein EcfA2